MQYAWSLQIIPPISQLSCRALLTRNTSKAVQYFHDQHFLAHLLPAFTPALARDFQPYKPSPAAVLHICKVCQCIPEPQNCKLQDSVSSGFPNPLVHAQLLSAILDVPCQRRSGEYRRQMLWSLETLQRTMYGPQQVLVLVETYRRDFFRHAQTR